MLSIITPYDRANEPHGAKIIIVGPHGIGKTSLVRDLDVHSTLFVDIEAGTLSIRDVGVDIVRPQSWPECRDLVVRLGGVDPAAPVNGIYSAEHLQQVGGLLDGAAKYHTVVIDSISAVSRLAMQWAELQPEAYSDRTGKKDIRGAYGLLAHELVRWIERIQHLRDRNVILNAVLELRREDNGFAEWRPQIEGAKTVREALAIVDEVISMVWYDFGDGKPVRAFITTSPNQWGYPGKDRSGKLDSIEEPNLAKLLTKLNGKGSKGNGKLDDNLDVVQQTGA